MTNNLLSESQQNDLAEYALKLQQNGKSNLSGPNIFDFVAQRYLAHKLSPGQEERFFNGALQLAIDVRPTTGSQDRVPYWIRAVGRGPNNWWTRLRVAQSQVDGGPSQPGEGGSGSSSTFSGWANGGSLPPQPPGKHHVRVTVEYSAASNPSAAQSNNGPYDKTITRVLEADFTSVEGHAPIATVAEPPAATIRNCLTADLSTGNSSSASLNVNVNVTAAPVDIAFDVFLRDATGKEWPVGGINFHKGANAGYGTGTPYFPKPSPDKIDLIFRSSEAVARGTTDLTQIWQGEIVLPNVPIKKPASQPAAASTQPGSGS
jgi:hypothetical protein